LCWQPDLRAVPGKATPPLVAKAGPIAKLKALDPSEILIKGGNAQLKSSSSRFLGEGPQEKLERLPLLKCIAPVILPLYSLPSGLASLNPFLLLLNYIVVVIYYGLDLPGSLQRLGSCKRRGPRPSLPSALLFLLFRRLFVHRGNQFDCDFPSAEPKGPPHDVPQEGQAVLGRL